MENRFRRLIAPAILLSGLVSPGMAGQVPHRADDPDTPITAHDRVYTADQTSNTLSVYNPSSNRLLGVLRLGEATPQNLSPLYRGQLLVHGLGFSFDHKTSAVVSANCRMASGPRAMERTCTLRWKMERA